MLLACASPAAAAAQAAPNWLEQALPAGGRLLVAGGISPGLACIGLSAPAGAATSEDARLPLLAPRAFLGAHASWAPAEALETALARLGWRLESRCGLEGAELTLLGPRSGLETVLGHLLERLAQPGALAAADLDSAWSRIQGEAARRAAAPELRLRERMAASLYAGHPYAGGDGRLAPLAAPPPLAVLAAYVEARYQAGAALLLVAGDLEPAPFLAAWLPRLGALPGRPLPPPARAAVDEAAPARLRERADASLLLYHFPGPAGDAGGAPALALLAGVLNQFVRSELQAPGLVSAGAAWYDYSLPGPRPLELQLRGFAPERLPAVEAQVARILERLRAGDFSEYQMITAKDRLFMRIDAAAGAGKGPADGGPRALGLWCREVLRESLFFAAWRERFTQAALGASRESLQQAAARWLDPAYATLGLLLPGDALD